MPPKAAERAAAHWTRRVARQSRYGRGNLRRIGGAAAAAGPGKWWIFGEREEAERKTSGLGEADTPWRWAPQPETEAVGTLWPSAPGPQHLATEVVGRNGSG